MATFLPVGSPTGCWGAVARRQSTVATQLCPFIWRDLGVQGQRPHPEHTSAVLGRRRMTSYTFR